MALNKYELVMVFSVAKGEEAVEALKTKFTDLIKANGTLGEVEEWGKRSLLMLSTTKQRVITLLFSLSLMRISLLSLTV